MDNEVAKQSDFYQILELSRDASLDEIKRQYRKLSLYYHPDKKTGDSERYAQINLAYKVLSNEKRRQKYDATLASTYDDLVKVERDTEYHRNTEFIKPDSGKFDEQKFQELFQNQNKTLDNSYETPVVDLESLLRQRQNERETLIKEIEDNMCDNSKAFRDLGQDHFNNVFEDLKKRNKELIETGEFVDESGDPASIDNATGIIVEGDGLDLQTPGFHGETIRSALFDSAQESRSKEWLEKASDKLLEERLERYRKESEELARLQLFEIKFDKNLLSAQELGQ